MKQYINRRDFLKAAGVTAAAAALAGCGVTSGSTATASSTAASSTAAAGKYDDVKADVTLTMSHRWLQATPSTRLLRSSLVWSLRSPRAR